MNFTERIQLLVSRAGGQNSLARKSGMSLGAIQRYLKGGEPTRSVMIKLCEASDVSINWLVYGTEGQEGQGASVPRTFKLYGFGDSGKQGWYDEVQYKITTALDWPDPGLFAIAAMDDTLKHEGIYVGFICLVSPNTKPHANDIVYVRNKSGQATLKKFIKEDFEWLYLQGFLEDGASYSDQIKKDQAEIIAPVIFVKRRS